MSLGSEDRRHKTLPPRAPPSSPIGQKEHLAFRTEEFSYEDASPLQEWSPYSFNAFMVCAVVLAVCLVILPAIIALNTLRGSAGHHRDVGTTKSNGKNVSLDARSGTPTNMSQTSAVVHDVTLKPLTHPVLASTTFDDKPASSPRIDSDD